MMIRPIDANALIAEYDRVHIGEPGKARQLILDAPTIAPGPQWVPVSERLPTARQSVILSTKDWTGEGCYWETTEYHVIWKGYRWNATYWDDEVVAWMPLPEPYGECEEKEGKALSEWQQDHAILKAHSDGANEVIDRIKEARKEMQKLRGCSCSCSDGIIDDVEDIIDKLIAEVEGTSGTNQRG